MNLFPLPMLRSPHCASIRTGNGTKPPLEKHSPTSGVEHLLAQPVDANECANKKGETLPEQKLTETCYEARNNHLYYIYKYR